jgi:hypothetical protein
MRILIATLLLTAATLAQEGPSARTGEGSVVTLADYFELGELRVALALEAAEESAARVSAALAERAARAVVRVRIHHDFRDGAFSTAHATGALVAHGKYVVTVGHGLEVLRQQRDARIEIVLTDGRTLEGRKRPFDHYSPERPETDWAWFDVVEPPADLPSLEFGAPSSGERLVLGYPGRHGRVAGDGVALDDPSRSLPLSPLRILCTTREGDAAQLDLTAGCVPIGGMSGAPCIDAAGRLVSIQRGVSDTFRDGRALSSLNVVALDALRAAVTRAETVK